MRVIAARLHEVRLPLVHVFQTSSHRKDHLDHILVELVDESGLIGWGEMASPADPFYCADTADVDWFIAWRYLIPGLLDAEWTRPAEAERTWHKIRGYEFAKAGIVGALWDLYAQAHQVSLASALGGSRKRVKCGVSLGIEPTIDALLEQVHKQVDAGYHRVKLKIAPGWDIEPVRAVRAAFPDHDIHVDANGAYPGDDDALELLAALDRFHLTMIEQPFAPRDFVSHAALQRRIQTPICLDESVVTIDDLRTMLQTQAGRILNIKVSRMGGLTQAKRAHDIAVKNGIPVWCGGMHEFGIGRAANLAISSLRGFTLPSDVSGSRKYYARDVIVPPVVAEDGWVDVPTGVGLGFAIDREWVAENALRTASTQQTDAHILKEGIGS